MTTIVRNDLYMHVSFLNKQPTNAFIVIVKALLYAVIRLPFKKGLRNDNVLTAEFFILRANESICNVLLYSELKHTQTSRIYQVSFYVAKI